MKSARRQLWASALTARQSRKTGECARNRHGEGALREAIRLRVAPPPSRIATSLRSIGDRPAGVVFEIGGEEEEAIAPAVWPG